MKNHDLDKKAFRKSAISIRDSLLEPIRAKKSQEIFHQLQDFSLYNNATTIMAYLSFRSEVQTHDIIEFSLEKEKTILLPKCLPDTFQLLPVIFASDPDCLEEGFYGLKEPNPHIYGIADPHLIDVVLVPGVAFSAEGHRMGYGAGYYDRFLPKLKPQAITIGLAFEDQIYAALPTESTDQPLDYLCTEKRILSCHPLKPR